MKRDTTMAIEEPESMHLQRGTIARLNLHAGFGYVREAAGENAYIFLTGKALTHADARRLVVSKEVRFRVSGHGRVDELVVD
jgi:cold shock CspA family protein